MVLRYDFNGYDYDYEIGKEEFKEYLNSLSKDELVEYLYDYTEMDDYEDVLNEYFENQARDSFETERCDKREDYINLKDRL